MRGLFLLLAMSLVSCTSKEEKTGSPPVPVEVASVIQKDVPILIDAVGNAGAWYTTDVRSQVTGVLQEKHIAEGQNVKVGQLIYTIDPAPFQAQLDKAKAQLREDQASLKLAEDKVLRYTTLAEKDYISELQYDELVTNVELMQAKVDLDKAAVEDARIQLDYCFIRSPLNGKLSYNVLDPGNLVTANSEHPLTTIRQMDPILINFTIPQKDFLKLQHQHEGEHTHFIFHMLDSDGRPLEREGVIYFVDNNFALDTGTILMKGSLNNKDYSIWPGEFGKVQIIVKTVKDGILVPQDAVQIGQSGKYVFVLKEDQTVESRDVTVVESVKGYFLVSKGVKPGEKVVVNGQINLQPGMKVEVREGKKEEKKSPDSTNHVGIV